jgi:hypothetical protein
MKGCYDAMTVNERLSVAGLFDQWDAAVNARNRTKMIAILKTVEMSEKYATMTTDKVLADPKFYGY